MTADPITIRRDVVKLTLHSVPARPDAVSRVLTTVGGLGIGADYFAGSDPVEGRCDMEFMVPRAGADALLGYIESHLAELDASGVELDPDIALVSVAETGLGTSPSRHTSLLASLARRGIAPQVMSMDAHAVSYLVEQDRADEAAAVIRSFLAAQR